MYYLMIKKCLKTGLMYLCQTKRNDPISYSGSGKYWKRHIRKHDSYVITCIIGEFETNRELKEEGIKISESMNVVDSEMWANLKKEDGTGGDTVSNRMWICKDEEEKYIYKTDIIPENWKRGRSSKCKFRDKLFQKEMNSRVDIEKRGESIKLAWDEGKFDKRDNSKCGTRGDKNPAKRTEVRKKISERAMGRIVSSETRRKQSENRRGKKRSDETRKKMTDRWTVELRKKKSEEMSGRLVSEETKTKMKESWKIRRSKLNG